MPPKSQGVFFCTGCIGFLAVVLVLQLCILASVLSRLRALDNDAIPALPGAVSSDKFLGTNTDTSAKQAVDEDADLYATPAPTAPPSLKETIAAGHLKGVGAGPLVAGGAEGLVLGAAMGISTDNMLIFLSSLLKVAESTHVVIFVNQPPPTEFFNQEMLPGIQRVRFEVRPPSALPPPWGNFHASNSRYWLYKDYLDRSKAAQAYRFIQVSDVRDVTFQSDPFAMLRQGEPGVHAFLEEPGILVAQESWNAGWIRDCYGSDAVQRIATKVVTCSGYTIGTAAEMAQYVERMASEISSHASCERNGIDQGVHNVLVHDSSRLMGMKPFILHANRNGFVWTGGYVPKGRLMLDDTNAVLNENGLRYAVLHQYDRHESLFKMISDKALEGKRKKLESVVDCNLFDINSGDVRGNDLTHLPADSEVVCCKACVGEVECGGFAFSQGRRHCWLKRSTGNFRNDGSQGDMRVGTKKGFR